MTWVPRYGPPQARTCWPWKRYRTAVIGRTESNARLLSQQQMLASKIALVSAKKSFTSESRPCAFSAWRSRRETNCANRSQCPGGSSECGPSAQYSAIIFCSSVSPALSAISSSACCKYVDEPKRAGPNRETNGKNSSFEVIAKGVTLYHCAPTKTGVTTFTPLKYVSGCQRFGSMTVEKSLTGTVLGLLT